MSMFSADQIEHLLKGENVIWLLFILQLGFHFFFKWRISELAFKECNCIILFLKNAVDLETELKSCIGMSKGMITSLGGRQLRNALGLLCRYRDRGNLGVLLPQSQGWEIEREKSYACFSFPFRNFNTEFLSLSIVVQQYFFLLCLPHHRLCGEIISVKCYWDDKTWLPLPLDCLCVQSGQPDFTCHSLRSVHYLKLRDPVGLKGTPFLRLSWKWKGSLWKE